MKRKADFFLAAFLLISFFTGAGFMWAISKGKSELDDGKVLNYIADHIVHFTPLILLWEKLHLQNIPLLILLILINIAIYAAVLMFMGDKLFAQSKSYRSFDATFFSTLFILLFLIICVIRAIIIA